MGLHFLIKNGKPCLKPMKDKCDAIHSMLLLKSVKECQQFCGMVKFSIYFSAKIERISNSYLLLDKEKGSF